MSDQLTTRSATELLAALDRGEVTSIELLDAYLARNRELGSDINAVVTIDEAGARETAREADRRRANGETAPLLGLPMTIKDALATAGMRSTGGAVELADHVPDTDAEVVARVRAAGAVVFGKTNLPRWSADAQAFNEIFGTTNNPWDLSRGPGGSSGGASAAVAAGLTGAEIGTDIGGSVRLPAHFAGVCGHKPSFGVVPQLGYISHPTYPLSEPDVNVIGPIARTVDDLELVFDVIAGPRPDLAAGWELKLPASRAADPSVLRVAAHLDDPYLPVGSEVGTALAQARQALVSAGVSIDDAWPTEVPFSDVEDLGLPLISAATSPGRSAEEMERYEAILRDPSSHDDSMVMRARASAMFHRDWLALIERREAHRRSWANFFERFDVLLAPVAITPAFEHMPEGNLYSRRIEVDGEQRSYHQLIMWTSQFGYVGLPSTVVPVGLSPSGLPVGIQIVGPHLGDRTTLAFARLVESVCGGYQVPPMAR
ncbi:MAG: amidase [Actinomycetota bacterium]